MFMERFLVPRGYGFITKTARVYAENKAPQRAAVLRSIALSNDAPDVWGLSYDATRYFDEVSWPDALRRTIYMNLLDRLIGNGPVATAEKVHTEATSWAADNADAEMNAWLLFAGSRLDARRQDFYRARDRAKEALKQYKGIGNPVRLAEIHNHIASVELQDNNPNAALEQVKQALELGKVKNADGQEAYVPNILARAEHLRGLIARRGGKPSEAAEHFRRANEVAGQAGIAGVALDSGLAFGEALLANGQTEEARTALDRVVQIARQLRNAPRERSACELLAQAEAGLRNFDKALAHGHRVLELTRSLKYEQALPIDLYNLGFFNYAMNKPTEALTFFRQAETRVGTLGNHPVVRELYYFMGLAALRSGNLDEARQALRNGLRPIQKAETTGSSSRHSMPWPGSSSKPATSPWLASTSPMP